MNRTLAISAALIGILALIAVLASASDSLRKGQVKKQFFSHSITESLSARPGTPLSTTLPCPTPDGGVRHWVEEPPVFHYVGAALKGAGLRHPAAPAVLVFLLLGLGIWLWSGVLFASPLDRVTAFAVAWLIPVFLRYSIQHFPDLLAAALSVLGAYAIYRSRFEAGVAAFTAAVTAKATVIFPLAGILLWRGLTARKWVSSFTAGALVLVPFAAWLVVIERVGVPNPFFFDSVVENRHSGPVSWLWRPGYWARFFTWVGAKGVGPVLFLAAAAGWVRALHCIRREGWKADRLRLFLMLWAGMLLPYWAIVRAGNFVHDYYFLVFAAPWALIGARELMRWKPFVRWPLVAVSITMGILSLTSMNAVDTPAGSAPKYCQDEMH